MWRCIRSPQFSRTRNLLRRCQSPPLVHIMMFANEMQTDRLVLRALSKRDFWFFCTLVRHHDVRRYLGGPVTWRQLYPRFKQYLTQNGVWVVKPVAQRRAIGLVQLNPHKDGLDYEVSYQFHPTSWGCGFAHEAVGCAIAHAIDEVGIVQIIAETQATNAASCRLLKRLGMTERERIHRFGAEQIIFSTPH